MRRCYLVCYDIRNQKRWRKVFKTMNGHGEHWQLSVFFCVLKDIDRVIGYTLSQVKDDAGRPIGAVLFCYMLLRSTVVTLWHGGVTWRGTFYPLEHLKRGVV